MKKHFLNVLLAAFILSVGGASSSWAASPLPSIQEVMSTDLDAAKAKLQVAIDNAKTLATAGKNGVTTLNNAIDAAQAAHDNASATVETINQAITDLTTAVKVFLAINTTPELTEAVKLAADNNISTLNGLSEAVAEAAINADQADEATLKSIIIAAAAKDLNGIEDLVEAIIVAVTTGDESGLPAAINAFKIANMEFSNQKYLLMNVASEKFWGAGNSWGTQASLLESPEYVTLEPQPEGTYYMDTQVSYGDNKHYFNGDFMDQTPPLALTITRGTEIGTNPLNGEPVYAYTIASGENYFGYDGSTTVLGKNLSATDPNALWVVIPLDVAKAAMATATADDPMDATFLIEDHGFGRNNRNANKWEGSSLSKGGDNANFNTESYMGAFDVYQTLTGIPNGVYEVNAFGAVTYHDNRTVKEYDGEGAPVIYANKASSEFNEMTDEDKLSSQGKMSSQFNAGLYQVKPLFVRVTDGTLKIGAKCERADIWAVWDNFTLKYYGVNGIIPGDINENGKFDIGDVVMAQSFVLEEQTPTARQLKAADMNGNGSVDVGDVVAIQTLVLTAE